VAVQGDAPTPPPKPDVTVHRDSDNTSLTKRTDKRQQRQPKETDALLDFADGDAEIGKDKKKKKKIWKLF
jgi:hypothetical protein